MPNRNKAMAALALLLAGCYALEQRCVYHPVRSGRADLPASPLVQDVAFKTADGTTVHGRWCHHPRARAAVLYCPGNAGNLEMRGEAVRRLWDALETSVLIFDYPGFGQSDGTPTEAGCYAAAEAAYQWLTGQVPPENVILYGESLGGGVAAELAGRWPHQALVLVRTFASLPEVAQAQYPLLPARLLMFNRFPSEANLKKSQGPVFVAQADADRLIPFEHGERLRAAAGPRAELFVLRGLGHNDPLPPAFYTALSAFLARSKTPTSPPGDGVR